MSNSVIEKSLSNGLRVVYQKIDNSQTCAAHILVKVGSVNEPDGLEGASHFLEHMIFKGSDTMNTKQISKEFDSIGAEMNAYTSNDHTCYYFKAHNDYLEKCLKIYNDILFHPRMNKEDFEKERTVIVDEIIRANDNVEGQINEKIYSLVFNGSSLAKPIGGTQETIESIKYEEAIEYFRAFYVADNMVLSICSDKDFDDILNIVENSGYKNQTGGTDSESADGPSLNIDEKVSVCSTFNKNMAITCIRDGNINKKSCKKAFENCKDELAKDPKYKESIENLLSSKSSSQKTETTEKETNIKSEIEDKYGVLLYSNLEKYPENEHEKLMKIILKHNSEDILKKSLDSDEEQNKIAEQALAKLEKDSSKEKEDESTDNKKDTKEQSNDEEDEKPKEAPADKPTETQGEENEETSVDDVDAVANKWDEKEHNRVIQGDKDEQDEEQTQNEKDQNKKATQDQDNEEETSVDNVDAVANKWDEKEHNRVIQGDKDEQDEDDNLDDEDGDEDDNQDDEDGDEDDNQDDEDGDEDDNEDDEDGDEEDNEDEEDGDEDDNQDDEDGDEEENQADEEEELDEDDPEKNDEDNEDNEDGEKDVKKHTTFTIPEKYSPNFNIISLDKDDRTQFMNKQLEQIYIAMGFKSTEKGSDDEAKLDILSTILAGNMSSLLFFALREENGITYNVSIDNSNFEKSGIFAILTSVDCEKLIMYKDEDNNEREGAIPVIIQTLNQICRKGIDDSTLELAKGYMKGRLAIQSEDTNNNSLFNGKNVLFNSKSRGITISELYEHIYNQITKEDINKIISKYINKDNIYYYLIGRDLDEKKDSLNVVQQTLNCVIDKKNIDNAIMQVLSIEY